MEKIVFSFPFSLCWIYPFFVSPREASPKIKHKGAGYSLIFSKYNGVSWNFFSFIALLGISAYLEFGEKRIRTEEKLQKNFVLEN